MKASRKVLNNRRHRRIRRKVQGTGDRPRLAVFVPTSISMRK